MVVVEIAQGMFANNACDVFSLLPARLKLLHPIPNWISTLLLLRKIYYGIAQPEHSNCKSYKNKSKVTLKRLHKEMYFAAGRMGPVFEYS